MTFAAKITLEITGVLKNTAGNNINEADVIPAPDTVFSSWSPVTLECWTPSAGKLKPGDSFSYEISYDTDFYAITPENEKVYSGLTLRTEERTAENRKTLTLEFTVTETFSPQQGNALSLGSVTFSPVPKALAENPVTEPVFTTGTETVTPSVLDVCYDMDHNQIVEINDLIAFAKVFGKKTQTEPHAAAGDFNCDGVVNINDLILFAKNYGRKVTGNSNIYYDPNYIAKHTQLLPQTPSAAPSVPVSEAPAALPASLTAEKTAESTLSDAVPEIMPEYTSEAAVKPEEMISVPVSSLRMSFEMPESEKREETRNLLEVQWNLPENVPVSRGELKDSENTDTKKMESQSEKIQAAVTDELFLSGNFFGKNGSDKEKMLKWEL